MAIKNIKFTFSDEKYVQFHFDSEAVPDAMVKRLCRTLNSKSEVSEQNEIVHGFDGLEKGYSPKADVTYLYKHGQMTVPIMECIYNPDNGCYSRGRIVEDISLGTEN